jgi:hypothetical protein
MKSPTELNCQKCKRDKSVSDFYMNITKPERFYKNGICKECQRDVNAGR